MQRPFAESIKQVLANWPGDFSVAWKIDLDPLTNRPATTVRVTGAGEGTCEHVRLAYGTGGPTGLFAGKVPADPVKNLATALAGVDFESLQGGALPGASPSLIEVVAGGRGFSFSPDSLGTFWDARDYCTGVLAVASNALQTQPLAAVALELAFEKDAALVTFKKLGPERLLLGNPTTPGSKAFLKLQVLRPPDEAGNIGWDLLAVPLEKSAFAGRPRWFELGAEGLEIRLPLAAGSPALTSAAVRANYGDPEPTPGLRVGAVEVFARGVVSNTVERS